MPPQQPKTWSDNEIPPATECAVAVLVERLLALDMPEDANGQPQPVDIPLSQDGRKAWIQFYNAHANEQAAMSGDLAAAFSKLEGYAARFALLVHLIRAESQDPTLTDPAAVDAKSIAAGAVLSRWFGDEVARVYAIIGGNPESPEDRVKRGVIRLVHDRGGRITPNDLRRRNRSFRTSEEAEAALQRLVDAGTGRWESTEANPTGGRPTRYFVLSNTVSVSETTVIPEEYDGLGNGDNFSQLETQFDGVSEEVMEWSA
jgi:hypothetical protein